MVTPEHDPRFWTGMLSASIAQAIKEEDPKVARADLARALDRFMDSPSATEELKSTLREMRRK